MCFSLLECLAWVRRETLKTLVFFRGGCGCGGRHELGSRVAFIVWRSTSDGVFEILHSSRGNSLKGLFCQEYLVCCDNYVGEREEIGKYVIGEHLVGAVGEEITRSAGGAQVRTNWRDCNGCLRKRAECFIIWRRCLELAQDVPPPIKGGGGGGDWLSC